MERGQVWLELRQPDLPRASVLLPFQWSRQDVGAILARVRNMHDLTLGGHDRSAAVSIASGKALRTQSTWQEAPGHDGNDGIGHGQVRKDQHIRGMAKNPPPPPAGRSGMTRAHSKMLHREKEVYVAECPEVGTVSQGDTVEEALVNLLRPPRRENPLLPKHQHPLHRDGPI